MVILIFCEKYKKKGEDRLKGRNSERRHPLMIFGLGRALSEVGCRRSFKAPKTQNSLKLVDEVASSAM